MDFDRRSHRHAHKGRTRTRRAIAESVELAPDVEPIGAPSRVLLPRSPSFARPCPFVVWTVDLVAGRNDAEISELLNEAMLAGVVNELQKRSPPGTTGEVRSLSMYWRAIGGDSERTSADFARTSSEISLVAQSAFISERRY
jgi:hypothetical protein